MISVAIDGPAGAGKSTVAKAVAKKLSFVYVDTGALYRTVGYYYKKNNLKQENSIISALDKLQIKIDFINGEQNVFLNNENVSAKIRSPEISMLASKISAIPEIRKFLLDLQRSISYQNNVVMDGRDIGTVVLPQADVKIFLTASPEKRALRRYKEFIEKGIKCDYNEVLKDIIIRDRNDSNRKVAPLKITPDSIVIDTSDYSLEESIILVLNTIKNKVGEWTEPHKYE